jgi:DHA2 family multidrug resistance protein
MVTTMLARRAQFHQSILSYHATNFDPAFQNQVSGLSRQLIQSGNSAADAHTHAYGLIYQAMQAQAQTLAYIDTYMVLAIGAGIMFLLTSIVRKNDPHAGGEVAVG